MKSRQRKPQTEIRMVQVGIRCEIWLKHALEQIAKNEERTVTQVCRQAMKEFVDRRKSQEAA